MAPLRPSALAWLVMALALLVAVLFTRPAEGEPVISDPIAGPYFVLYAFQVMRPGARLLVATAASSSLLPYVDYAFASAGIKSRFLLPVFPFLCVACPTHRCVPAVAKSAAPPRGWTCAGDSGILACARPRRRH